MANQSTLLDSVEVRDLEDGSTLSVGVYSCSELGNRALPGLQLHFLGNIVNLEPLAVERWAYQARKAGQELYQGGKPQPNLQRQAVSS